MNALRLSRPAAIQYAGLAGISKNCLDAVRRYVQFGDQIEKAKVLTAGQVHCLLLELDSVETVAIKSGFSSGYVGEGPRTFADVLWLLDAHGTEIEEYNVTPDFIERLDASALTAKDMEFLDALPPVRPRRWHDYIYDKYGAKRDEREVWQQFPECMPWAIIEPRLLDLAKRFFDDPDQCILKGFRRLEDILRSKLSSDEHSTRLLSQAFSTDKSRLTWKDIENGEQIGRANLFVGAYMAFRNPRAHKELGDGPRALAEFLLLNELFILEGKAIERPLEIAGDEQPS